LGAARGFPTNRALEARAFFLDLVSISGREGPDLRERDAGRFDRPFGLASSRANASSRVTESGVWSEGNVALMPL